MVVAVVVVVVVIVVTKIVDNVLQTIPGGKLSCTEHTNTWRAIC